MSEEVLVPGFLLQAKGLQIFRLARVAKFGSKSLLMASLCMYIICMQLYREYM